MQIPIIVQSTFSNCNNLAASLVVLQQDPESVPVGFWAPRTVFDLLAPRRMHANCAEQCRCMQALMVMAGPLILRHSSSQG